ncbi:trypsin-like peptidase domain-containing protein [Clostridium estertheticum]|uniref:S1C family serine protease n=1 Tax=Clostridium estertheticum TaxID=238834 RepID=UPI001CF43110|nr:trypsin-like peptidase domain-containing protein [Clostridium estertheticum]MCB2306325.1 trypsin-like peptidase domain-containing protein [Clostridium estertheticum]MCB2344701.1 trypsin-like peptidase domain-containing protein [Clostridium estertheticum]MCB2349624.1 trypsin-like peptidase domain-containing protein [Clostridium estertheticum]WAG46787.1 trypsin-like peptidase domain-containing protein [Clostridium estertheticum]
MNDDLNNNEISKTNETNEINKTNDNITDSESNNKDLTMEMQVPNEDYKEKESKETPPILENNNYSSINDNKVKKNKGGMRKRIVAYIIVGVICSALGGAGSAIVTMNIMKDTNVAATPKASDTKVASTAKAKLIASTSTDILTVPQIVKKVSSSVVAISTKTTAVSNDLSGQTAQQEGVGTGVIFNKDGYILTNYHVVSGAQNVKVTLSDGKEVSAKVINYDSASDVAVIKLADNTKVPGVAEFGDSAKIEVGESVVAIGNPLGKEFLGSVTTGVVSALNRQVSIENKNLKFIQTDAAINAGNSGGPLVNSKGQVIGINTAKIGETGVEGLGFSIPINTITPKIENLIKPILNIGISCRDVTSAMAKEYNSSVGVLILQVKEFSAAEKGGITAGDIIVKFDGKNIKTVEEINKIKATHKAGDVVKTEIVRDGKTIKVNITLSV